MGASRTRQVRAAVFYKEAASDDESEEEFSTRKAVVVGKKSRREDDVVPGKGRKNLALKRVSRSQEREEALQLEKALKESLLAHDHRLSSRGAAENPISERQAEISASHDGLDIHKGVLDHLVKTPASAFDHLVDVAFGVNRSETAAGNDVSKQKIGPKKETVTEQDGVVYMCEEKQCPVPEQVSRSPVEATQVISDPLHDEVKEKHHAENVDCRKRRSSVDSIDEMNLKAKLGRGERDLQDEEWSSGGKSGNSSSDTDSWMDNADDSDCDAKVTIKRTSKNQCKSNDAAKEDANIVQKIPKTKGLRSKSNGAGRPVQSAVIKKCSETNASPVGISQRELSSKTSKGTQIDGCIGNSTPAASQKSRSLKTAMKKCAPISEIPGFGSPGGTVLQAVSPNVPHRRVLGLSKRFRPPPLHPYLPEA